MKFLTPQLTYLLTQRETRENLRALSKYIAFLTGTVVADGVAIAGSGSPGSGGGVVVEVGFDGDAHRGFAGCPKTSARGWRCKAR